MNSKAKGTAGELEAAHWLTDHGHLARRGQQYAGGTDSPDIICPTLEGIHFEVKRTETFRIYDAMEQARIDANGHAVPVVMHRRSRSEWLFIMRAEDGIAALEALAAFKRAKPEPVSGERRERTWAQAAHTEAKADALADCPPGFCPACRTGSPSGE